MHSRANILGVVKTQIPYEHEKLARAKDVKAYTNITKKSELNALWVWDFLDQCEIPL